MRPTSSAALRAAMPPASARLRRTTSRSRHRFAWVAIAVAAALSCGAAAGAERAVLDKNFKLPASLAGFSKGEVTDFESKKPGLGQSVNYVRSGWRADIYIYDMGLKSIPSGPKNAVVVKQLEQAKQDIYSIQKAGHYSGVEMKGAFEIKNAAGKPAFNCVSLQLVRKDMGASDSYLCMTGAANKFVKVRLSTAQSPAADEIAKRFVTELAGVLPAR
jgi:hypothetical protein